MTDSLSVSPDAILVPQLSIQIPDNLKEVDRSLNALGDGINAGGWATAAVVYAFTDLGSGGPRTVSKVTQLSLREFAELGIRGLASINSVRKYRHAWASAVEKGWAEPVGPGEDAALPQQDFKITKGSGDTETGDEWFTPPWLFQELGIRFSIDVCAPEDRTHVSVPADRFFTIQDDGLEQRWDGTVWCNPPYSTPEPWALRMIDHNDGLLLSHMPMNAAWCARVWQKTSGLRLFQAMDFVRPDGSLQRPGYWLQLAAFGSRAHDALSRMEVPEAVVEKGAGRVPSPLLVPT